MADTDAPHDDDPSRRRIVRDPLARATLLVGAPLALAMALQVLFNLVDQYLIARLPPAVADPSLDALGICDMVAALGTIVSYGVSSATATLVSQAKGRQDDRRAAEIGWGSVGLVTVFGLALGALTVAFADPIVHLALGAKGVVRSLAVSYLRVIVGGSVTVFVMFQITAVARALGQTRLPLATFVAGNVLNLFLAVLMVYGPGEAPWVFSWGPPLAAALHIPRMEVVGAAWATVIARALACAVPMALLARSLKVRAYGARFLPGRALTREIVSLAWPTSAQFVVRTSAVLLVIGLVHHAYTTSADSTAGTAYALCLRAETMALFVSMGWGSAAQTFVGMNLGASQPERAERAAWWLAGYTALTMLGLAALFFAFGRTFLGFFSGNPAVLDQAMGYLTRVAPAYTAFGVAIVLGNAVVGAGAARLALKTDLGLVAALQLPLLVAVTTLLRAPPLGLWNALVFVHLLSALVYAHLWRSPSRWRPSEPLP